MKAVVQRVIDASVSVDGALKGAISSGLLVYLGVAIEDTPLDADWLIEKIPHLRIFDDSEGKMNISLLDMLQIHGVNHDNNEVNTIVVNHEYGEVNALSIGVLAVSQFTLLGDARKGRRPSWGKAAPPEQARELYHYFIEKMSAIVPCAGGEFQAHMQVTYTNDGPVTILLDSADLFLTPA